MKCKDYLDKIMRRFEQSGDARAYDTDLELMESICEDYQDYIESLKRKYP